MAPQVSIELVDASGNPLERVRGGGSEFLRISFLDVDDPTSSVTGDLVIEWPGASPFQLPIDLVDIQQTLLVELTSVDTPLESGQLLVKVDAIGRHGASITVEKQFTFLLTPPMVIEANLCGGEGPVSSLRFGETIVLYALVDTERPVDVMQVSMSQLGWSVVAPQLAADDPLATPPPSCLETNHSDVSSNEFIVAFRLRLDGSFIQGEGQVMLIVRDLDGLSSSTTLLIEFFHAAPSLTVLPIGNATAGERLESSASVTDLDGMQDVTCQATVKQGNASLANISLEVRVQPNDQTNASLAFSFPTTQALGNTTLELNYTCIDGWGQEDTASQFVDLAPKPACDDCHGSNTSSLDSTASGTNLPYIFGFIVFLLGIAGALAMLLRGKEPDEAPVQWDLSEDEATEPSPTDSGVILLEGSDIPGGWSPEAYFDWLSGPMPEGWSDVQWAEFSEQQMLFFEQPDVDDTEKD
jgi:hypothetical protein